MFAVLICLAGLAAILVVGEIFSQHKVLKGEYLRKFYHIGSAIFIASWPWLISWRAIQLIGLAMLLVIVLNRIRPTLHISGGVQRKTAGDLCFALAVIALALLTKTEIFFAVAMLHIGLADGLAALVGTKFGGKMRYKVLGQTKSVIGTMTFWIASLWILGIALLGASNVIPYSSYVSILILLPPALAILENLGVYGIDNLTVPIAVVLVLNAVHV